MMLGVVSPAGTGRKAIIPGHSVGGKTGTTNLNKTAAFGGITPDYSLGIIYFDPKGKLNVGGVGGGVPAQIYHDTMAPILASQPNHPFPAPDPAVEAGTKGRGYVPAPTNPTPTTPTTPAPPADNQPPADTGGTGQGGGNGNGNGGGTGGGRPAPGGGGGNGGPITTP
jgi:membrane peptidoglycan carboxypeptidase